MANYAEAQLGLIDKRIDDAQVKPTKMGTVISRETATARAVVALDGTSGGGQPVKCFETTLVDVGDRVGLIKFEGDWIIVGNYTPHTLSESYVYVNMGTGGSTTSSTFVDMPSSPGLSIQKWRDVTQFQIILSCSLWVQTSAPTNAEFAVLLTYPDGTQVDIALFHRVWNSVSDHQDVMGGLTTVLTLPGEIYTFTGRWRRSGGSGTLVMDSNDGVNLLVKEVLV